MVAPAIIALIVIIVFFAYLGWMFFIPLLELFINGILLYAVFLRSYVEIVKEKKQSFYLGGAVAAMIIYLLAGRFLSGVLVWGITTFIILAFAFAQIGMLIKYLEDKYGKPKARK